MTAPSPLRILLLCHSFNSLSQRLMVALKAQGHEVSVELDISDTVTEEAVALFKPDLLLAPFLKRRIPQSVWRRYLCLVLHPGPPGDQGPSALDWALLDGAPRWGVTVLQATADYDAGPVWASAEFTMRDAPKGSIYRHEVADAAEVAVLQAVRQFMLTGTETLSAPAPLAPARWRPLVRQADRAIDWTRHTTAQVLARLHSADGQPGVVDQLFDLPCRLWDGHAATGHSMQSFGAVPPGTLLAQRDGAVLRATVDGGVWIGQACLLDEAWAAGGTTDSSEELTAPRFKLPTTMALPALCAALPERAVALERDRAEWSELHYTESGPPEARVGSLSFDFYNGAMSSRQCKALLAALREIRHKPLKVLLLLGGQDFFSNGIHLNCIEAAAYGLGEDGAGSAADASWNNINAMNDVAHALITTTDRLTVAVLRGNAGAGGAFLALAADKVWAHQGVLLNPHYKNMGNLYGSEYWTYLLPRRLGQQAAQHLMQQRLPVSAPMALKMGLIDRCLDGTVAAFEAQVQAQAQALASTYNLPERLLRKQEQRARDEAARPLAAYRQEELSRMHRNFYGFDPSYHVARYHFVHKLAHAWTPRHLALHRA
ncbi:enoyl-CoA hydratase-related protein [Polaromonas sp.]|uniref:enoyl-CoA hydratase-related protein n=1 Tax=Polaromonas sp. TaxID=1869339 RepID=UPI0013B7EDC4|nr:enoyl-CoA hydratase-related protein [Polaromonas sp.]NDP64185.1 hydrogenase maturation protein [Polaromonas sp.]